MCLPYRFWKMKIFLKQFILFRWIFFTRIMIEQIWLPIIFFNYSAKYNHFKWPIIRIILFVKLKLKIWDFPRAKLIIFFLHFTISTRFCFYFYSFADFITVPIVAIISILLLILLLKNCSVKNFKKIYKLKGKKKGTKTIAVMLVL